MQPSKNTAVDHRQKWRIHQVKLDEIASRITAYRDSESLARIKVQLDQPREYMHSTTDLNKTSTRVGLHEYSRKRVRLVADIDQPKCHYPKVRTNYV